MKTALVTEDWPIARCIPYARNPRKNDHAVDQMAGAIKEFGFKIPILVCSDGTVIDGHLRLKAAQQLALKRVPVILCDEWTEAQVKAFRLLANRSATWAEWDEELLALELQDLQGLDFDLNLTGFSEDELAASLARLDATPHGLTDEDEVPESPEEPVTQLGDLWVLGKHRLLCGDSTEQSTLENFLKNAGVQLVVTDPPYGIDIVKTKSNSDQGVVVGGKPYGKQGVVVGGGSAGHMYPYGGVKKGVIGGANIVKPSLYSPVINDDSTETAQAFYTAAMNVGLNNLIIFGGNYFTQFLPPSRCWIVWDKQNSGNFAAVEMAWTSFDKGSRLYQWMWNGLSRAGERKTELEARVHPTQKPVGLFEKIFVDFKFSIYFDGFLGSGSTLIACEKTGRTCYGMELAPAYCDVIITRWQNFTGKQAILDGAKQTFAEISDKRKAAA